MKKDLAARRLLSAAISVSAPFILTILPYLFWTPFSWWMANGVLPDGLWVWTLLPPALVLEWWTSRWFDPPPAKGAASLRWTAGLILRLATLCVGFFVLVGRTAALLDTPDIFAPLIGLWPAVAAMPYIESPVLGAVGLLLIAAFYLGVTIRRRALRMTTVVIAPALFTIALFQFYYAFPTSPLHFKSLKPDSPVEQVYPFKGIGRDGHGSPFMAREIFVTPDEKRLVASYGVTFQFFSPGRDLNLSWIDLEGKDAKHRYGRVIRSFVSTCPDLLYMAPWGGSTLLEVDPMTFDVNEIALPSTAGGLSVDEIHGVVHDCESRRVTVANSRNPAIFVWNTGTKTIEKTLTWKDLKEVRVGDHVIPYAVHPTTRHVYLGTSAKNNILALSPDTLAPERWGNTHHFLFDISISPDGRYLYGTSFVSGHGWRIETATLAVTGEFKIPMHCRRVATSKDGRLVHFLSYLTGELFTFDAATGVLLKKLWIGPKPEGLFVTDNYVWISCATGIFRIPSETFAGAPASR